MSRTRLTPPVKPVLPASIRGPMPNGDAQDPPVDRIALATARAIIRAPDANPPGRIHRVNTVQLHVTAALIKALDRCQVLGGRREK